MKGFRLSVAVGAVALLAAAVSGSSAFGGPSGSAQGSPIKIGAITPVTGPFVPWGNQVRAGMALAVNEINRKGGVKGRGQGRKLNLVVGDDQSVNVNAATDAFRRLTQQDGVVSVGGTIHSGVGLALARLAEQAKVPLFLTKAGNSEILTPQSRYTFRTCLPSANEAAIPVLQFAQKRNLRSVGVVIADYAWGQSFKSALEDAAKSAPNINFKFEVAPVPTTNFVPYLRDMGDVSLIVGTGHPPGAPLVLAQAGQLGIKAPVVGAWGPYSLTVKQAGASAFGRAFDFKCMATATKAYKALAKRYLRVFPQNEFFEDDALSGYAYVKIIAQAIQNVGPNRQRIAAYVHSHTFNIPGYAWPLRWTAWGEMIGARPQLAVLTKSAPPQPGLNTASTTFWPKVLLKSAPLTPYRPPS